MYCEKIRLIFKEDSRPSEFVRIELLNRDFKMWMTKIIILKKKRTHKGKKHNPRKFWGKVIILKNKNTQ